MKSKLSAPTVAELRAFEDDVARFRDVNNEFLKELECDKKIKSSTSFFVPADKTRIYHHRRPTRPHCPLALACVRYAARRKLSFRLLVGDGAAQPARDDVQLDGCGRPHPPPPRPRTTPRMMMTFQ